MYIPINFYWNYIRCPTSLDPLDTLFDKLCLIILLEPALYFVKLCYYYFVNYYFSSFWYFKNHYIFADVHEKYFLEI